MSVLAIQPGAIGDFVVSLPALRFLRQSVGADRMEIWCERVNVPLAEHPAYASRVRPLAETGFDSYPLPARTLEALCEFDLVISWRGAAFTELRDVVRAAHPRAHFLPQFPAPGLGVHLADFRRAQIAELFGADAAAGLDPHPRIFLDDAGLASPVARAKRALECGGWPPLGQRSGDQTIAHLRSRPGFESSPAPLAVIHPGASSARKRWPAGKFADVALALQRDRNAAVLISEGPLDAEAVVALCSAAPELRAARLRLDNLRHLAAVLSRARLYVGNDSGIAHLAAAAGCPTVAVFVASDPLVWAPRGPAVTVLEQPSVSDVLAACEEIFHERTGAGVRHG